MNEERRKNLQSVTDKATQELLLRGEKIKPALAEYLINFTKKDELLSDESRKMLINWINDMTADIH